MMRGDRRRPEGRRCEGTGTVAMTKKKKAATLIGTSAAAQSTTTSSSSFAVPSTLQDLERTYRLDRYPADFDLSDALDSFESLVRLVEDGNRGELRSLLSLEENNGAAAADRTLEEDDDTGEDEDENESRSIARSDEGDDGFPTFISRQRLQALYTLVRCVPVLVLSELLDDGACIKLARSTFSHPVLSSCVLTFHTLPFSKSTILESETKKAHVLALCEAVQMHCRAVIRHKSHQQPAALFAAASAQLPLDALTAAVVVSQNVRDSLACHLYLLYATMVTLEQSQQHQNDNAGDESNKEAQLEQQHLRTAMMASMVEACHTMISCRFQLWRRGVVDETLVMLPARVSYRVLEKCRGVTTRKIYCGDHALTILSMILEACRGGGGDTTNTTSADGTSNNSNSSSSASTEASIFTTNVAALMDLMHSFEHMAPLCCELCTSTTLQLDTPREQGRAQTTPNDPLAVELMREVARAAAAAKSQGSSDAVPYSALSSSKASGIAWVAPFLPLLASSRPHLVMQHLSHLVVPLLQNSDSYHIRTAVVQTMMHVLDHLGKQQQSIGDGEYLEEGSGVDRSGTGGGNLVDPTKSRDSLLTLLMERAYDVSSFTRAATLKALSHLALSGTLPHKTHLLPVTHLAMDRLKDKTVVVRKQSMQLLTTLLENHPYLESLNPEPYRSKLSELYEWVKAHFPESVQQVFNEGVQQLEQDENGVRRDSALRELENAALAAAITEAENLLGGGAGDGCYGGQGTLMLELSPAQKEYCTKIQALKFTQSALEFINALEDATTALESMLLSANTSDVVEALRFFVQARHFDLPCAVTGMKRALSLLWSSEQAIRDEVIKSFVDVFVAVPGTDGKELLTDQQITKNLLVLTSQATASELVSIEEAVQRLVDTEVIPPNVFLMLWSISSSGSSDKRAAAVRLLAMGASADSSIVDSKSRLKLLLDAGLGAYSQRRRDWRLAGAAAICLQRVERATVDPSDAKYLLQERILGQLQAVARGDWCDDTQQDTLQWFPAAEQAIKAIFAVSPEPEKVGRKVIMQMYQSTLHDAGSIHPLRLARFFHIIGQVSLQLLLYTEALCAAVRRVNAKKTLQRQEEADKAKSHKRRTSSGSHESEDNAIEAELGIAAEIEAENEREMSEISEKEIVGRNLIGQFGPLLARVVANEDGKFGKVQIVMQAAMLALVKLMCVSSKFCEDHLGLLFSALANAPPEDTTMRANTVVALGDLAFRFPNEVEPYTPHLYACLRDPSTKVRRHTLMVLTHLILNDMVRVKGQVCEIALCLRDDDPRIRDMSRLLFHELSKRTNNPVYNLLPDIISNLGQPGTTTKEDFRSIMTFLLGFIKKERQNEMLVDKLCHRFPTSGSISQKADLAYCIAQLKMNERTIKCLNESYKLYKDALHDEDVYKSFLSIVTKAKKKFNSGDALQLVEDWEAKIMDAAVVGQENEDAEGQAARATRKAGRKQQRKKQQPSIPAIVEEDEEDEELDMSGPRPPTPATVKKQKKASTPAKRPARKKLPTKRAAARKDSDDEDDEEELTFDDEEALETSKNNKENKPKHQGRKKASSSSSRRGQRRVMVDDEISD